MNTKNLVLMAALIAGSGWILAGRATAQTFTTLYSFTSSEGAYPSAGLISSSNTLYGMAEGGGLGAGAVFKVDTDGAGFTTLHSFTVVSPFEYPTGTNSEGASPRAGFVLSGNTLYGTAQYGGSSGNGTLFKVNVDGTGFTNLHTFAGKPAPSLSAIRTNSDGAYPQGLILSGSTLYGTAIQGGSLGHGTVFKVNTDGTGFTNLHSFTARSYPYYTNSDGSHPVGGLVLSGNTLYGTAAYGGSSDNGTVFALKTDGTGFSNLHNLTGGDGAVPIAGLTLSGNTLYGTTQLGGSSSLGGGYGNGTVFAVNTDGTGFTTLHSFTPISDPELSYVEHVNSDGSYPQAGLFLSGNTLYGTAPSGGSQGYGTVFAVNTDGAGFIILHDFAGYDGAYPVAALILAGRTLYGATQTGSLGYGTLFKLLLNRAPAPVANVASVFAISPAETDRFILAPNNAAAIVVLDGSQSSDPDNDPLQFTWYADGQPNAVATGEVATSQFVVGPHRVQLVVSDGQDTATAQVSFEVITPATAVGQLMLLVDEANLGNRTTRPLLATLSAAMSHFDRGDVTAALNLLSAFQNKVRAQLAPGNPAVASEFTTASQQIITVVSERLVR